MNAHISTLEVFRDTRTGQFGEQHRGDPGNNMLQPSRGYTTVGDLIEQELVPALDGVSPNFDVEQLAIWLRQQDLIVFDEAGQQFHLLLDEAGQTPGFWDKVQQLDSDAAQMWTPVCPACGHPETGCMGHNDPAGVNILAAHEDGDHQMCAADCHDSAG